MPEGKMQDGQFNVLKGIADRVKDRSDRVVDSMLQETSYLSQLLCLLTALGITQVLDRVIDAC